MTDFIFLGSKTTADGDSSHKIKRRLLLGRKAITNLDSILKVGYNFFSKEQASFNFLAAVTIFSDFGAPQNEVSHCFNGFPVYLL